MENLSNFLNWNMSIFLVILLSLNFLCLFPQYFERSEQQEPSHGQATDMDMKAFEDFWKIFAIGNFKNPQ